jgi:aminomethyltransferase
MKTFLYDEHLRHGAKIVDFFGWQMPLSYPSGEIHQCSAVRNKAALFDVSHMGLIFIEGKEATHFLDTISTCNIALLKPSKAIYTLWCNEEGGTVDDVIIYKRSDQSFFVVVNAANRSTDEVYLNKYKKDWKVNIEVQYEGFGILALQGPKSRSYMDGPKDRFSFIEKESLIISSTGYTGEDGFEIIGRNKDIKKVWDYLLNKEVEVAGLAARNILRLEKGYPLYGHEMSLSIKPSESFAKFAIKKKNGFIGDVNQITTLYRPIAFKIKEGIARDNMKVFFKSEEVGFITSGTFSPTLNEPIALALIKKEISCDTDESFFINIRGKEVKAYPAAIPFV